MSKENDLILTLLANPLFTTLDFLSVGLSANNTSLEDELKYLDSEIIQKNPIFQNNSGEFDKVKFHSVYVGANKIMQLLTDSSKNPETIYSKYNIFAPLSLRDMSPQFELVKAANPDRITKSMIIIGQDGPREYTPSEIAQSLQIYDSQKGKWIDTPEDLFSFKKLFNDPIEFLTGNFGSTKVLALYDADVDINGRKKGESGFDENNIEHVKGEYMLNDNGTYYYRTLKDGENIYGKQVLHYSDILTREGSALNSIDFLDSDDIEKSPLGSFVKNASLIGAMFLPYVGPWVTGATIFLLATGLGATLGKIALGSDNPTMNWIEGLSEATNPMNTRSEYSSGDKMWTTENLLGMIADVVGQLKLQRMLFKFAPMITKGKWGISEETLEALKAKYISELESKNINSLEKIIAKYGKDSIQAQRAGAELLASNQMKAAAMVENYMKDYYKAGEELSKVYMTMLTINDIYGEAKEAGAGDFDSAIITAGYAAMEYALLSTDIGKWILPELRANRLENKAIVTALTKDTLETFKKLGVEARTSETAKRTYLLRLLDFGKNVARGEFNVGLGKRSAFLSGEGLLKAGFGSLVAGATAEAVEETSEEVLADFSRVLFNGLQSLKGHKDIQLKVPWEDDHFFDRYAMSFLGGFLGGGISSASMDFSLARKTLNMDYNQAVQLLIWKTRNNDLDGIYKILNSEEIGNKNLSSSKFIEDENGNRIWKLGDENDNQDLMIKKLAKRQIKLLQDTLEAHGGNMSDESLLDAQTLKDLRFRILHQSTTAGRYILKYNQLLGQLIDKTSELKNNTPIEKAEKGETDKKGESKETKTKRKKLEEEIKQLEEQIDNFNTGKLAPLFMTSALLESTPFISEVFMRSSFKIFAENKAKIKFENIPEGELKLYLNDYLEYLRTSKKDDLDFATEGYLALLKIIGSNFAEAVKVSEDILNDEELKQLLGTANLSTTVLNMSETDNDSWSEAFQNYISENPLVEKFNTNIQLIRNTYNEALLKLNEKYNSDLLSYKEKLDSGEWDEELYNNSILKLEEDRKRESTKIEDETQGALEKINSEIFLLQANQLADKFIDLGYINGAIKDLVISKLEELSNTISDYRNNVLAISMNDDALDLFVKLESGENELKIKIEQIKNLKYTPILLNLDLFALNLNGTNISKVLEELGKAIQSNKTNISAFTFGKDIHHAINEADRVLDLYIAALEGARTDTVDPFNVDKTNLWGINKVLNEIHSKAPKIENDTWEDLPEIDGNIANMMLMDARSIKNLLFSYKKLFNINRGKKLEVQSRVGARTSYLIYDRIKRLLTNVDFPKDLDGTEEFRKIFDGLEFFNKNIRDKEKKDWNINLNIEEQIALEKDRITLEDAIFDLFNTSDNLNKLESFFNNLLFNIGDIRTTLLTEDAEDIDESSFIGYLASKIAIKSSDFYPKYKELIKEQNPEHPIAPILGQEIGVQLGLANILNGPVITKIILAYRNSIYNHVKNLDFNKRKEFFEKNGMSSSAAALFSTLKGFEKFFASHDLIPLYENITFVDGVAGSGKTSAIDSNVIKYLQKYNPETLKRVWTAHGGDSNDSANFAKGLRLAIGLIEDDSLTFNRDSLMNKITPDRTKLQISEDGKSYEFKENEDYVLENGKVIPKWKLNNFSEDELPSLIVIDEALQFTQLDLLTIDKFAKKYGIPVIMSGDLQLTQMDGLFSISKEDLSAINNELSKNKITIESGEQLKFSDKTTVTLKLNRNLVLHTPKIGTSMRTENNLKNSNMSMMLALMELGKGQATFHYFESDSDLAGDKWITPNEVDEIKRLLDKVIPNLKEGEKVNFAYASEDSNIYKALKADNKYWDKINPIKGIALGLEGNYWILDINPKLSTDSYLLDLYTGITRAKKASIIVADKIPSVKGSTITLENILDKESHPETYSKKDINKFIDKRIQVLEGAVSGEGNKIPYNPREEKTFSEPLPPQSGPVPLSSNQIENWKNIWKNLVNKGILDNVWGYSLGREILIANINGIKVPFYKSSSGTDGKVKGKWYPFFGFGAGSRTTLGLTSENNWLIKGTISDMENGYNIPEIKTVLDILNNSFQWMPNNLGLSIFFDHLTKKHGIFDAVSISPDLINTILFGNSNSGVQNGVNVLQHIKKFLELFNNIEPEPIEEISTEEIPEEGISNEKETLEILSESNIEDNAPGLDKIETSGLSKKDFNFFLFSNATFELGTNKINSNGTFEISPILGRIDCLNGLAKLTGNYNYQDGINKLARIRELLMSVKDKSKLELYIANELGISETYIRFAIKTSEFSNGGNGNFDKLDKLLGENLPYARTQVDPNSESKTANNRHIVAIIGRETQGDVLELPLLTLNNPITIINLIENDGPKFPEIYNAYYDSFNRWVSYATSLPQIGNPTGFAQAYALDDLITLFGNNSNYEGFINLVKEYRAINRHITFIDDENWTIGKNLHSFGPQLNIGRGQKYLNFWYILEDRWVPLSELKKDPQLHFSNPMHYTDKSGLIENEETGEIVTLVSKPKHPFVLYTDSTIDHNGKNMSSDLSLVEEYVYQRLHPEVKLTIKLVYILPPKFTLKEYLNSLIDFTNNNGKFVLGNQRTAYKILEALILNEQEGDVLLAFKNALGELIGQAVYDKIVEVINLLKNLSFDELIKLLTDDTPQAWNINGFGISKEVLLYQLLLNTLKQLVYPTTITITGNINHKGANRFNELFPTIDTIFQRSKLSMFFQTRGSKDSNNIILGKFSPLLDIDFDGNIKNDYLTTEKGFSINGNLSTSTFMADEAFNEILAESVLKQTVNSVGQIKTPDNPKYTFGYSGFKTKKALEQTPSINSSILSKLSQFGISTAITPTTVNDSSILLKQLIANEINSNINSSVRALVLPNGELILGSNELFKGKQVLFNLGENPFESLQAYMLEVSIDGIIYDVNYTETDSGKNMELTLRKNSEIVYNFGNYKIVNPDNLSNIDKVNSLLDILMLSSKPIKEKILTIKDSSASKEEFIENISKFLTSPITKALFKKLSNQNFDFSEFTDILEFELQQDSCQTSIKILFI